jgi:hypothetical protein
MGTQDEAAIQAGVAEAMTRAEKSVAEHAWLPLPVAFQVQLAADLARAEKFAKKGTANPPAPSAAAPAPTAPVDQARLDERRLAMD